MQNQAKSITRKIEDLRHHSRTKQKIFFPHSEALANDKQIELLKEMLHELSHRIQQTQSKEQLQAKVKFILMSPYYNDIKPYI